MSDIEVVTPADILALTTLERARLAGVEEADDAKLEMLIGIATARIERATNRVFARERVIESFWTAHPGTVFLSRTPIVEIHGIAWGSRTDAMEVLDEATYSIVNRFTGVVSITGRFWGGFDFQGGLDYPSAGWGAWGYGPRYSGRVMVAVEYTGGYVLPGMDVVEPDPRLHLPADLEAAMFEYLRHTEAEATFTPGLVSKRLGDAAWTYAQPGSSSEDARNALPRAVQDAIAAHRRIAI